MKKTIIFLALALSTSAFSQRTSRVNNFDQYSIEADYGLTYTRNPIQTSYRHFGIGFRYMMDEYWGMKIDYAHDGIDDNGTKGSLGSLYDRVSAQAVYNIGRTFNLPNLTGGNVNLLLHSGIGYSRLNPYESTTYDNMVNFIIGGTAQLYINESLAFTGDLSGILNFRQNSTFGSKYMEGNYTGKMITASIGLTYYFGRNENTADFR